MFLTNNNKLIFNLCTKIINIFIITSYNIFQNNNKFISYYNVINNNIKFIIYLIILNYCVY